MVTSETDEPKGPRLRLNVDGEAYQGWETATVTRGMETLSGTFELTVNEMWDGLRRPWRVRQGDSCSVEVRMRHSDKFFPLITGHVERKTMSFNGEDHTVSVSGRDAAGLLVDSSALLSSWDFTNVHPVDLVKKICEPHKIKVALHAEIPAAAIAIPKKYAIDPGDTAAAAIENVCRVAGLLAISDGLGGLILARAGTGRCTTALVEGRNVKAASATYDHSGRFHRYVVLGSHKGRDDLSGKSAASVRGEAIDQGVLRESRVLVVRPEGNVTVAQATTRAEWEKSVRRSRACTISVTVQGWTQADDTPWPINKLVNVKLPTLGMGDDFSGVELLITRVTHTLTLEGGTTTELELRRPGAFRPEIVAPPAARSGLWDELRNGV